MEGDRSVAPIDSQPRTLSSRLSPIVGLGVGHHHDVSVWSQPADLGVRVLFHRKRVGIVGGRPCLRLIANFENDMGSVFVVGGVESPKCCDEGSVEAPVPTPRTYGQYHVQVVLVCHVDDFVDLRDIVSRGFVTAGVLGIDVNRVQATSVLDCIDISLRRCFIPNVQRHTGSSYQ